MVKLNIFDQLDLVLSSYKYITKFNLVSLLLLGRQVIACQCLFLSHKSYMICYLKHLIFESYALSPDLCNISVEVNQELHIF